MPHVFISYNQADGDFAALMQVQLERAAIDTWMDRERLRAGVDWSDEIDTGIRSAFALVLVVSPDSRASEYVTYEWSFALGVGVRVVPILLHDTEIHPRLRRLQYLDFRGKARQWDELVRELVAVRESAQASLVAPHGTPSHLRRAAGDLDCPNPADRRAAIDVLAESDHPYALVALRYAITHPHREVRANAALALLRRDDDETLRSTSAVNALVEAIVERCVAREAIRPAHVSPRTFATDEGLLRDVRLALAKLDDRAVPSLAERVKSQAGPVRAMLVWSLGQAGGARLVSLLTEFVRDSDVEVAVAAVHHLGACRAKSAVGVILDALESLPSAPTADESPSLAVCAAGAITAIGMTDPPVIARLEAALGHASAGVRMAAAEGLGALRGASAVQPLVPLLGAPLSR
jgi:HEAT repeat protein